jgi:hypothetical protein
MIIRVDLEPAEIAVCKMMGNLRSFSARTVSSKNTPFNRDTYEIDEDGFIGEYAFCKHWNIFFDITAKPRTGSADCLLKEKRFDVKTTRVKSGKLIAKHNDDIDVFALAILHDTYVLFPGYITAAELYKDENKSAEFNFSYVVEQNRLQQWKDNG